MLSALDQHPTLGILFTPISIAANETIALKRAYSNWLKATHDYVTNTRRMLAASAHALKDGDAQDKKFSAAFTHYLLEETDPTDGRGHEYWAANDLRALGTENLLELPEHPAISAYSRFFVTDAAQHPYALFGSKGVLERLSIKAAPQMLRGLRTSSIQNIENAVQFISGHGELDQHHVPEGNAELRGVSDWVKLEQMLIGAYVTTGTYLDFLRSA